MRDKIKTLVLVRNGVGVRRVFYYTVLRGILRVKCDPLIVEKIKKFDLLAKVLGSGYDALSYMLDWQDAFVNAPELDVEVCNMNNLIEYNKARKFIKDYPLVIILHSAAGDDMSLLLKTAHWFQGRKGKLVIFIGNEYDLMPEKVDFIRSVGADYICSQLPIDVAEWLYGGCESAKILPMPHALNPEVYYPSIPVKERKIDIGFIGAIYPYFIGDIERRKFLEFIKKNAGKFNLRCDIRFLNVPRKQWALFLNSCRGIVGAEAGTYFLDRRGILLSNAKEYIKKYPRASFEEIYKRFFERPDVEYTSGKAISSRHFEAIGTKTCQILLEGYYNGILKPDIHYISVKKDLSNIRDALERFMDESFRERLVKDTYEYVLAEHTYRRRVETLFRFIS